MSAYPALFLQDTKDAHLLGYDFTIFDSMGKVYSMGETYQLFFTA